MKLSDIQPGVLYWACPSEAWDTEPGFPVRFNEPAGRQIRYRREDLPGSGVFRADPFGQYLRGVQPGDPGAALAIDRDERVRHVRASSVRGTAEWCLSVIETARHSQARVRDSQQQAEALQDRFRRAGVRTAVVVPVLAQRRTPGAYRWEPVPVVEDDMEADPVYRQQLTVTGDTLWLLLQWLEIGAPPGVEEPD